MEIFRLGSCLEGGNFYVEVAFELLMKILDNRETNRSAYINKKSFV